MFTGLIEAVGTVSGLHANAGHELHVRTTLASELRAGESVAVNGVCLTVTAVDGDVMRTNLGPETARVTTLASLQHGQRVNLERSMRADARFGGHFVQGHVDAIGTVDRVREDGEAHWVTVRFAGELAPFLVPKGSVAVDGISLTIARLGDSQFDVMIIPFTWAYTNLSSLRGGDRVNIECDMLGKYVVRAIELFGTIGSA